MHPISSRSSVPAPPSSTANSSNEPPTKINNKEVREQPETHPSTGLDYSSSTTINLLCWIEKSAFWLGQETPPREACSASAGLPAWALERQRPGGWCLRSLAT